MMTVTAIREVTKSRVLVSVDETFAFVLYKGELRSYGLKEGQEITEESYRDIMENLLPRRAKLRAMNLLKSRSYTEKQLYDKLKAGDYPEEIIEQALDYVRSYHYIDDRQYAEDYIEYHKESRSRSRILRDLVQKGISAELAGEIYEEKAGEDRTELEKEQILALMRKKNFSPNEATFEEKQKFSALLYRKGFQIDTIRCALLLDSTSI